MGMNGGAGGSKPPGGNGTSNNSGRAAPKRPQSKATESTSAPLEAPKGGGDVKSKLSSGVRSGSPSSGINKLKDSDLPQSPDNSKSKTVTGSKNELKEPSGAVNAANKRESPDRTSAKSANGDPDTGTPGKRGENHGARGPSHFNNGGATSVNNANLGREKKDDLTGSNEVEQSNRDSKEKDLAASKNTETGSGKKDGLMDKAKGMTSNATGVDYSDKSMKDQLEHQAADVAMDSTPGLAQANSARKKLKEFNKQKKDAGGGDDGITNKVEDTADKAVDKGIKATKILAASAAGTNAAGQALMGLMMMKMLMMLKGVAVAAISKVAGVIGTVFNAVSSFFSGVLGVGTAIGNAITAGVVAVSITVTSALGYGVIEEMNLKDDSIGNCVPERTTVRAGSQDYLLDGELEIVREANAVKVWSVYERLGGSKEQTAAVLGNLQHESALDPTGVETIYNEPFQIGPRKQTAMSAGFLVSKIDAKYAAKYPAIKYVGIGIAQWTNGRNTLLVKYAQSRDANWYDFDTQIKFMLEGDDTLRQKQLIDFLHTPPSNVQKETERFMNTWIGLSSPNKSLSQRLKNSTNFMFVLERATADTAYADSILSDVNIGRAEGNSAVAAYYQDDGCGNAIKSHYGNQSIDGTGEVPADLVLVPWSRETLPASLRTYAKNPEDAGLAWGNATGWANGIIADQCAALAHSYFMRLYPDWNQGGKATERPYGDGKDVADGWAKHYDQTVSAIPASGAVFSDTTTSRYGHTGIVQHVFANGDILVNEQNIRGVSGRNAPGLSYSWSWRVIKKDRYEKAHWKFFKPANAVPQWTELDVY
ncbi:phage tail tip lysozyme [Paenibacillus gallinarum]|uniref:Phage tail lysozyme domain-containing protein n=1 Tax=Paenibacillus gallinarum TaxID=2762232 RepID=A0ABR8T3F6_9BACL|nr:phage tail tip lysozyme [Paenibacillus gallinarum]MBD7970312.1 phage tail lysozyme domain-containing protein [Paenibacillus gallinarum]